MITDQHRNSFNKIKAEFWKKIVLLYFSKRQKTILQTDASKKGFGAVTLQRRNPVYYTFRTLSSADEKYHNLERECMGNEEIPLFSIWRTLFSTN